MDACSLILLAWFVTRLPAWACLWLVWSSSVFKPPPVLPRGSSRWRVSGLGDSLGRWGPVPSMKASMGVFLLLGGVIEEVPRNQSLVGSGRQPLLAWLNPLPRGDGVRCFEQKPYPRGQGTGGMVSVPVNLTHVRGVHLLGFAKLSPT